MCRIAGYVLSRPPVNSQQALLMRDIMYRGGPDDAGIQTWEEGRIAFLHRRLSIIDLSPAGHQPFQDIHKEFALIFNGEIYNYKDLKAELQSFGHVFRTQTDTEVLLACYQQWGTNGFTRLRGMYAFALFDKQQQTILLFRDQEGIKPLYWAQNKEGFFFSSEVKAFLAWNPHWPLNPQWKTWLLTLGHLPEPHTTLLGVQSLAPGQLLTYRLSPNQISHSTLPLDDSIPTILNKGQAQESLRWALTNSVQRHLIADAPIGLFLSGGIDSSLLTLLAHKHVPEQLKTLSLDFDVPAYSEQKFQDIIIAQTGAQHHREILTEAGFLSAFPDILKAMDQPSNDGINTYFISRTAKERGLKAVLSGIGADEYLGGYPSFRRGKKAKQLLALPNFLLKGLSQFPVKWAPKLSFLTLGPVWGMHLLNRGFFTPHQAAQILESTEKEVWELLQTLPYHIPEPDARLTTAYTETKGYMRNQLLKDSDYMSMWHGLEIRVPYLDHDFRQTINATDPNIRFGGRPKQFLIDAFSDLLPKAIWDRPKQGFVLPFQEWMGHLDWTNIASPTTHNMVSALKTKRLHWSKFWVWAQVNGAFNLKA